MRTHLLTHHCFWCMVSVEWKQRSDLAKKTEDDMAQTNLTVAARKFLSVEGETTAAFVTEWKRLSPKDKSDLRDYFIAQGVDIAPLTDTPVSA